MKLSVNPGEVISFKFENLYRKPRMGLKAYDVIVGNLNVSTRTIHLLYFEMIVERQILDNCRTTSPFFMALIPTRVHQIAFQEHVLDSAKGVDRQNNPSSASHSLNQQVFSLESGGQTVVAKNGPQAQCDKADRKSVV